MNRLLQYKTFFLLLAVVLAVFIVRTLLAVHYNPPRLFELFDTLTVAGSIVVLVIWHSSLGTSDWALAICLGVVVGVGMLFATLFSPYPFFGIIRDNSGQALVRGIYTSLAALGGLTIMRRGGPIQFRLASSEFGRAARNLLLGLMLGVPLAVLNILALQFTEGHPIVWQNPIAALLDALQPGILEEVVYRFALWSLLWLILNSSLPDKAVWLSGALATLIHAYVHFDVLFVQSPLAAIGMGLVLAVIWGMPMMLLARLRSMESAIAFHWVQDVARFLAGF